MSRTCLSDFVHRGLAAGASRADLAAAARNAGWPQAEIDRALESWIDAPGLPPVPRATPPAASARDVARYGLLLVLLALIAWYLCALGFAALNAWLPEPGESRWGISGTLRWGMAALIPCVPVFLWLDRRAEADATVATGGAAARGTFAAVATLLVLLTLLGDLIAVLYALLAGELTLRFVLKVLLIAATGIVILGYLRRVRGAALALAGMAAAALAAGLAIAGGPAQGRAEARDLQRSSDLMQLSGHVDCRRAAEGTAPPDLAATERCPLPDMPVDPSGSPYRYERIDADGWRLCAAFEVPAPDLGGLGPDSRGPDGCITTSRAPLASP